MVDVNGAIATIKAIAGVATAAGKIDLYGDIINHQQTLLEVIADNSTKVEANARLTEEVVGLRERVASLERMIALQAEMTPDRNVYWRKKGGGATDGPYCPKCFDGSGRVSRMTERSDDHWWRCPVCDGTIEKPGPDPYRRG